MARNNQQRKRRKSQRSLKPVTHQRHKNRQKSKSLITKLHMVNKELEKIKSDARLTAEAKQEKGESLQKQIEQLGGLETYQQVSKLGEYHHGNTNTSKWILQKLQDYNVKLTEGTLDLLDVGALDLNYKKQKWLKTTAIDLNPQRKEIQQADFLQYQESCSELYDILVLSLVVNFVGDPVKRGEMLKKATALLKVQGYLFVVLPLACLENSRYLSEGLFKEMLNSLGFHTICTHDSRKLTYLMAQKREVVSQKNFKKRLVRNGTQRNNFSIILRWVK
ncbi:uncharacterized protein LOC144453909 [Glandiceps talaboti]